MFYINEMSGEATGKQLKEIIKNELQETEVLWIEECLHQIFEKGDIAKLYLTYSQLSGNLEVRPLFFEEYQDEVSYYLDKQSADTLQLARVYLLVSVLEKDFDFFAQKVAKIIQVADQSELITFLKFITLLPKPDYFLLAAVDSLRTNITPVFEAISMKNPYPATYFNEQQWNQMYLKAAFMQLDLGAIIGVEERANAELARIISDYAHERWAASRDIDPMIWRPVSGFMNDVLLKDMRRLLESDNPMENKAGALCCYYSQYSAAHQLLSSFPDFFLQIEQNQLDWNHIKV